MQKSFIESMQENLFENIESFPKSDLHSHAGRGGNVAFVSEWIGKKIPLPPTKFQSLEDMNQWYIENIRCLTSNIEGQLKRWEACFHQANKDSDIGFELYDI